MMAKKSVTIDCQAIDIIDSCDIHKSFEDEEIKECIAGYMNWDMYYVEELMHLMLLEVKRLINV